MDYDDSKIDDDLDKILQHIKEDQQNSMDAPDSPKEDALTGHGGHESLDSKMPSSHSRHLLYTTHFPLPQVISYIYFSIKSFKCLISCNFNENIRCRLYILILNSAYNL